MLVTQTETQMKGTFDKIPGMYYLSSVYTVYKRQMLRLLASKTSVVFMLLMPLMWLSIIGLTFNNFLGSSAAGFFPPGVDYITFMTPGILIMVTMFTGMFGAISLFYDKDSGYLKNYLIAPINRTAIVTGYILGVATRIIIQDTILLGVALVLNANISFTIVDLLAIYVYAILTTFFIMGLAITIASKAPNVETFQNIVMPISMPIQFLAPVMYPIGPMPDVLKTVAYINPLTYGIDGLRNMLVPQLNTQTYMATIQGQSVLINNPFYDNPVNSFIKLLNGYISGTPFQIPSGWFSIIANNLSTFFILLLFVAGGIFLLVGSRAFLHSLSA